MRIVINGGGGVGQALAGILSRENHDVTVVEVNPDRCEAVSEAVDCHVITGTGVTPTILREAGVDRADIFAAVTDRDEVNLLSCVIARKLSCPRCIARVRDKSFSATDPALPVAELGIDQVINPDEVAAREIVNLLENPGTTQVIPLVNGAVIIAGITIDISSPCIGRPLSDLPQLGVGEHFRVAVIRRGSEAITPTGKDEIRIGDEIFVIAQPSTISALVPVIVPSAPVQPLTKIMLFGASDLGRHLAAMLQHECEVKLVDISGRAARSASEELERTLVIQGSGHDMDLLEREGLAQMSAFVAVSDEEEANLIACLYAKRMGVPRAMARVERDFYRPLIMNVGVDAAVSARQATVNALVKYIHPGDIRGAARLRGVDVDAVELVPSRSAKVVGRALRDLHFPRGSLVGVIVRGDGVVVPTGDTVIEADDHVVVFTLPGVVNKVERMFA
jgi:trk system potassium uptake protein TrkA